MADRVRIGVWAQQSHRFLADGAYQDQVRASAQIRDQVCH